MYVCIYVCLYVCVCMYVCHNVCTMYVCVYTYVYVCQYVSMHVCLSVCFLVNRFIYMSKCKDAENDVVKDVWKTRRHYSKREPLELPQTIAVHVVQCPAVIMSA